nr:golgin subfamily A member 1-like [Ciona intestinalis]|eukprot:XP_002125266.3 golgin subfamily A member 1-like [Ciona intestinalis]
MFKKLRQKLESDEVGNSPGKDGIRRDDRRLSSASSSASRLAASNLVRTDSLSSLNGSEVEMPSDSSSKEELSSMLIHRTTQVKRLEVKLAEYGQTLKERSRECEKLTSALEKQQDNALRKLNELNETYTRDKKRSEGIILKLEETEKGLSTNVERLETENEKMKESIDKWEKEKEDFERKKTEFYEKRDNSEELHDLQNQELAKLKHMLLNSEKQVKELQISHDGNLAELIQCRERNDELESLLCATNSKVELIETTLQHTTTEKEILSDCKVKHELAIKSLTSENSNLRDKLSCLALDLQKTRSSLSSLENTYSSLVEKYEGLKHNNEFMLAKTKSENAESESLISHLQEKLKTLELRSHTDKLPQDERLQAVMADRLSLENKLEESRQQLLNIKSTWSDKINLLEKQVSNLNAKISEDREEIAQKDEEIESLKSQMKEQVAALSEELNTCKVHNDDLTTHNNSILLQISELEAKLIEMETMHEMKISKMKQRESGVIDGANEVERKLRMEIEKRIEERDQANDDRDQMKSQCELKQQEFMTRVNQLDEQVSTLQQDIVNKVNEIQSKERLNSEMLKSMEDLRKNRDDVKEKLEENLNLVKETCQQLEISQQHVTTLQGEVAALNDKLNQVRKENESSSSEVQRTSDQLNEIEEQLKQSQSLLDAKDEEILQLNNQADGLKHTMEARSVELLECKEEIAYLKNNQVEGGEEVDLLRADHARLQERLTERERQLKLTQQRLNDVKKTLQKELSKQQGEASHPRKRSSSRPRDGISASHNHNSNQHNGITLEPEADPLPSFLAGKVSLDDPSLSEDQKDVVSKYLKHVVLRFLSCGQSEAQPLIKAISTILRFTPEEEKLVKDVLEYRTSWFAARPNAKNILKPSLRGKNSRHHRR